MFGIILSRSYRKYANNLGVNVNKIPLRCYAAAWWKEIILYKINDVCDCKIWCKYPITKTLKKL